MIQLHSIPSSFTFGISNGPSYASDGLGMGSDSRLILISIGSSVVDGFAGRPLSNGLAERFLSDSFGIFGRPIVNGISFLAKIFGTLEPNNE